MSDKPKRVPCPNCYFFVVGAPDLLPRSPSKSFVLWSNGHSGFIGTAQVHSEDVRKAGHARYTAAFMYQLLMRRTFPVHITATLPSGEVVSRIGEPIKSRGGRGALDPSFIGLRQAG